jgi:hypothetical protein
MEQTLESLAQVTTDAWEAAMAAEPGEASTGLWQQYTDAQNAYNGARSAGMAQWRADEAAGQHI